MAHRRRSRASVLVSAALACAPAGPNADEPARAASPSSAGDSLAEGPRSCGEPGPSSEALPERLSQGVEEVGSGTVALDVETVWGGATLNYDSRAWIGPRNSGHFAHALKATIDQTEAPGEAWGSRPREVRAGEDVAFEVGPYSFRGRAGPGDPPLSVEMAVTKRRCPRSFIATPQDTTESVSAWVSTSALEVVTLWPQDVMAQAHLTALPGLEPELWVSAGLSYRARLPLDEARLPISVEGLGRRFTLEKIVRPPASAPRTASAVGAPERSAVLHARVRLSAVEPRALPGLIDNSGACGEPTPGTRRAPAGLAAPLGEPITDTVVAGPPVTLGPLTISLAHESLRSPRRNDPGPVDPMMIRDITFTETGVRESFARVTSRDDSDLPRWARIGTQLVRVDGAPSGAEVGAVQVTAVDTKCPHTVEVDQLDDAAGTTTWLSTRGITRLSVAGPDREPGFQAMVFADAGEQPSISLNSGDSSFQGPLRPEIVGEWFDLGELRVRVLAIEPGAGTTYAPDPHARWVSEGFVPEVHVGIRVTQRPDG